MTLVWPPITSIMAGPPPLNGTCRRLTPAVELEQLAAEMLEAADRRPRRIAARRASPWRARAVPSPNAPASSGLTTSTFGPVRQDADRRERLDRIVGQLVEPRIDRVRERDDQQRVAVVAARARPARCRPRRRRRAAVVDDHLLAEPLAEMRGDQRGRPRRCCRRAGTE